MNNESCWCVFHVAEVTGSLVSDDFIRMTINNVFFKDCPSSPSVT